MASYRVVELPANNGEIIHPEVFDNEADAKKEAKATVAKTHNPCRIQRNTGDGWRTGSVRYFWFFDRVCFYNP